MIATFSHWLKQQRKALDLTQEALAELVGCSVVTVKKIEADQRRPSRQIAALLAQHLRVPADEHAAFVEFARTGTQMAALHRSAERQRPPHNLPTPPTPLIGRADDLTAAARLLARETTQLVTLLGPP